jgi:PPOX class probable F420-dependent enzyme
VQQKLASSENIWFASVRPDGRPHLSPVWFAWVDGYLYISIDPESVKSRNLAKNPNVVLALEDGLHPVICEGQAEILPQPWPEEVLAVLFQKYEWDLNTETQYNRLVLVRPERWLTW